MSVVALVVAAGSGTRFGGPVPKPLVDLDGRPVVTVAVASLADGGCEAATVLVSPGMQEVFAEALADAPIPVMLVDGGQTRQESVSRGLEALAAGPQPPQVVLIHDAVRPLVPADMVGRVVAAVRAGAAAVTPALPVVDSLRRVRADGGNAIVDRSPLRRIQTPQGFDFGTVLAAHRRAARSGSVATDDVSVCEAAGHPVTLVEGAASAVKITHPADLELVRALVRLAGTEAAR
ncbi:MAG: 2-C-methyl-D-erythritol 4-phosphate cytidylyltransferase [Propionicimonas sp.]|jgi:2-C-methyl-D-erythritol 4-phosphate cytidylyltransferase